MVNNDAKNIAGVNLADCLHELELEGVVVADGIVGHHVKRDGALLLKIEIAVDLLHVWVALYKVHDALLQLFSFLAGAYGINAYSNNDVIFVVKQFGDGAREPMYAHSGHRVRHADVERANDGVGAVVVEDDVIDAEYPGKLLHVLLDVVHHVLGYALA